VDYEYDTLTVRLKEGVAFVAIHNPPINLLDTALVADLDRFNTDVRDDEAIRVIVFESADPEFFIAHGDMRLVADPDALAQYAAGPGVGLYQRYRSLPQITIGKVAGRVRGAGNEFLLTLDMRFAAIGHAWFGQPEVSLGIFPGGGGTQQLPRLMGRARALEVILGSDVFDAGTAERYGWINRALPPDDLDGYVDRLASRIASYPQAAVAGARKAIDAAAHPLEDGLKAEGELLWPVFTSPAAAARSTAALAAGAQTRDGELDLEGLLSQIDGEQTELVVDWDALYQGSRQSFGDFALEVIPWRLDAPQPIVIELADTGQIEGPVLECGCGLGDNALFLAERGYQVTAFDVSATVIDHNRTKATERGFAVDFRVADATVLDGIDGGFNTVLDSALLHCLADAQRRDYLAALHRVTEPGARLHILCFPELEATQPMRGHTDEASLRRDLSALWRVERMEIRQYTSGMSRQQWEAQFSFESPAPRGSFANPESVDEQGRILLPIWQITAIRD
jgi:enoyl-CoA hydratase/carnithine racemase/SAM-dependent methyltransferase